MPINSRWHCTLCHRIGHSIHLILEWCPWMWLLTQPIPIHHLLPLPTTYYMWYPAIRSLSEMYILPNWSKSKAMAWRKYYAYSRWTSGCSYVALTIWKSHRGTYLIIRICRYSIPKCSKRRCRMQWGKKQAIHSF